MLPTSLWHDSPIWKASKNSIYLLYNFQWRSFLWKLVPKKKKTNFKYHILLDPLEWGGEKKFEIQSKQVHFGTLWLLSLISNLEVVQKMVSPTMSKTTYFDKKKTQGILGVKVICRNYFKKFDHMDCKILEFEVKKWDFFHPTK